MKKLIIYVTKGSVNRKFVFGEVSNAGETAFQTLPFDLIWGSTAMATYIPNYLEMTDIGTFPAGEWTSGTGTIEIPNDHGEIKFYWDKAGHPTEYFRFDGITRGEGATKHAYAMLYPSYIDSDNPIVLGHYYGYEYTVGQYVNRQYVHLPTNQFETQMGYLNKFFGVCEKKSKYPGEPSTPSGTDGDLWFWTDKVEEPDLPANPFWALGRNVGVYSQYVFDPFDTIRCEAIESLIYEMTHFSTISEWTNPLNYMLHFHALPISWSYLSDSSYLSTNTYPVRFGKHETTTTVTNILNTQFIRLDLGELDITYEYGMYLDYKPFSSLKIFLPFIGEKEIDVNDLFSRIRKSDSKSTKLHLKYDIDTMTGICIARIGLHEGTYEERWIYSWNGKLSWDVPFTGSDFSRVVPNMLSLGISAASGTEAVNGLPQLYNTTAAFNPTQGHSGDLQGLSGWFGVMTPYLIWTVPRASIPKDYAHEKGLMSNITYKFNELVGCGFVKLDAIHLDMLPGMTQGEYDELVQLLKEGVIL